MTQGLCNMNWAKTVVDQLIQHGVDYFCLSPGNRCTPLSLAVAEDKRAKTFIHFDERGSSFHALGYAKASGKPAAIIVTSGSALGNLMPAVMEAWAAHIPLILLTSDRPVELRDTMANQTADQIKLFGQYVRYFFDFPTPSSHVPQKFISTTIAQAVFQCHYPLSGPIQLNLPFPEPLSDEKPSSAFKIPKTEYSIPKLTLDEGQLGKYADKLSAIEKGVIIIGGNGGCKEIQELSEKLQWPIFCDIISGCRENPHPNHVSCYHHILKLLPEIASDCVLYFGDAPVSKFVLQWMSKQKEIIHVARHHKRCDPLHVVTDRIVCDPKEFCLGIEKCIPNKNSEWLATWKELSQRAKPDLKSQQLSEPEVIKIIQEYATPEKGLYIANSMPIRDAEMFFFPENERSRIFANRGLSGIDGNIGTIAGIAQVMPVIAVIGDQTALHDLNSLAQLSSVKYPVKLVIINNGGGGIFSFVSTTKKEDILDKYFAGVHSLNFEHAAKLFHLDYTRATTGDGLGDILESPGTCLIEVTTVRRENVNLHGEIDAQLKDLLTKTTV